MRGKKYFGGPAFVVKVAGDNVNVVLIDVFHFRPKFTHQGAGSMLRFILQLLRGSSVPRSCFLSTALFVRRATFSFALAHSVSWLPATTSKTARGSNRRQTGPVGSCNWSLTAGTQTSAARMLFGHSGGMRRDQGDTRPGCRR